MHLEVEKQIERGFQFASSVADETLAIINEQDEWLEAFAALPLNLRTPFLNHLYNVVDIDKEMQFFLRRAAEALAEKRITRKYYESRN